MAANKLVINGDKTHLVVMGTKKTAARRQEVSVQADGHIIQPSRTEKLLGGVICEDMKWKEHLLGSDQSLDNLPAVSMALSWFPQGLLLLLD